MAISDMDMAYSIFRIAYCVLLIIKDYGTLIISCLEGALIRMIATMIF